MKHSTRQHIIRRFASFIDETYKKQMAVYSIVQYYQEWHMATITLMKTERRYLIEIGIRHEVLFTSSQVDEDKI